MASRKAMGTGIPKIGSSCQILKISIDECIRSQSIRLCLTRCVASMRHVFIQYGMGPLLLKEMDK